MRLVVGCTLQRPDFIFPSPWVHMMAERESTIFEVGMGPQIGEGQL